MKSNAQSEPTVLIVGAGPVGLLAANLAAASGFGVTILEARKEPRRSPRAIGITPPSLEILRSLGLHDVLIAGGRQIEDARVWGDGRYLGHLDMTVLPPPFSFILSVSQVVTEKTLRHNLESFGKQVDVRYDAPVTNIREQGDAVAVDTEVGGTVVGSFVLGCDGPTGISRRLLGVPEARPLGERFAMLDLPETTEFENRTHLYFSKKGSLESFPFGADAPPANRRRWIAEISRDTWKTAGEEWIADAVATAVAERAGVRLDPGLALWQSRFEPRQIISPRYVRGRLFLCGDAAHEFSPIGGQGMNTGFADAEAAVAVLVRLRDQELALADAARLYQGSRRPAAKAAARRAQVSMWIGTRSGTVSSPLRNALVSWLLNGTVRSRLPKHFAMLTLPKAP